MENGRLLRHFGLLSEPFRLSPRRRDFFPPNGPALGADALLGDPDEPARLVIFAGEPGTGRTSAVRRMLGEIRRSGWLAFAVETTTVPHPELLSHEDILLAACRNFGLFRAFAARGDEAAAQALRDFAYGDGSRARAAIAVDDADRLADQALAGLIDLIANVPAPAAATGPADADADADAGASEPAKAAPGSGQLAVARPGEARPGAKAALALILSGSPDFRLRLDSLWRGAGLPELREREAVEVPLRPLSAEEVTAYVDHCLDVAGYPGRGLFEPSAVERLAKLSGGVLGELNAMAAQAMIFAWQGSRQSVGAELIAPPGALLAPERTQRQAAALPVPYETAVPARAARRARRRLAWIVPVAFAAAVAAALAWTKGPEIAKLPPVSGILAAVGLAPDANGDEAYPPAPEEMADQVLIPRLDSTSVRPPAGEPAAAGDAKVEFLVERGEALLRGADAVSARHFFARAAETGSAEAATAMAASYDPLYLERNAIRGVDADPEQAAAWYRVAIARGDQAAVQRLNELLAAPKDGSEATASPPDPAAQPQPTAPPTQP